MTLPTNPTDREYRKFKELGEQVVVKVVDTNSQFRVELSYDGSDNIEYVGLAEAGTQTSEAKWQIKKLVYSGGNLVQVLFADGDTNFDNIWDNRASLSYS